MPSSITKHPLTVLADKATATLDDGRLLLDPHLMPGVCPHCGAQGSKSQILRIKAPYDWRFWLAIGGFLGFPLLFGVGAVLAQWILGPEGLEDYLPYGVIIGVAGASWGGLSVSRSNRENWFLTYYFCDSCVGIFKKLLVTSRWFMGGATVLILAALFTPVFGSVLKMSQVAGQVLATVILASAFLCMVGCFWYRHQMSEFRGLSARWKNDHSNLKIRIRNPQVAESIKSRL